MDSFPPFLSGTIPSVLDPSQPTRILKKPNATLFFAVYDPRTASGFPGSPSSNTNQEDDAKTSGSFYRKRIAIEADPDTGACSWRFVPQAHTEPGFLGGEGSFPRLVDLCGLIVLMTLDQWDLYKLDPLYHCVVRAYPKLTMITRVSSQQDPIDSDDTFSNTSTPMEDDTPPPDTAQSSFMAWSDSEGRRNQRSKSSTGIHRTFSYQTDSMSVDEEPPYVPARESPQEQGQDFINEKKRRWAPGGFGRTNFSGGKGSKRTAPEYRGGAGMDDGSNSETPRRKKFRTRSPGAARRDLNKKRQKREKARRAHLEARLKSRRETMHQAFWNGVGVPPGFHSPDVHQESNKLTDSEDSESSADESDHEASSHSDSTTDGESEGKRLARIEESRRKLAELEKDRHIWEENARRRQARDREEEEMRQRAKQRKEDEERQQQQAEAARRQQAEKRIKELQQREREKRLTDLKRSIFVSSSSPFRWSARLALDRYLKTAASFDVAKFSAETTPVTFAAIPWPMPQASFSMQDIEWSAVEEFFGNARTLLSTTEYKKLVEASHKRFHPDRWQSRRILSSTKDEVERDLLEVAGNTVAQAITPLWKGITGH